METELKNRSIEVTSPYLPELEEFLPYLEKIWENKSLTNNGPFHNQLESGLASYLNVPYVSLFSNGTLALVSALQALRVTGEVITTPYSFVATSHSLLWNSIKPIFVDIEPHTLNINPKKIEAAITPQTTAIVPVHCYGNPCDTAEIERIAEVAFESAMSRTKKLCSIDKANVLESTELWRNIISEKAKKYPEVELSHMYVDNAAMQLVRDPKQFDVIISDNLFGDIISDQAGALAGSLGMLPSASLPFLPAVGETCTRGSYEPVHGSAPDIYGKNIANPIGMILSISLFIEYGLGGTKEAEIIRNATEKTLAKGIRTKDIGGQASSESLTDAIIDEISCAST